MAQLRGTFAELYDNFDREVHALLGKEFKALAKIWPQIYDVRTSSKQSELYTTVTGMGDAQQKAEGQPFATDILQAGYTKEFLHLAFGLAFEISMEAQEDDRH